MFRVQGGAAVLVVLESTTLYNNPMSSGELLM